MGSCILATGHQSEKGHNDSRLRHHPTIIDENGYSKYELLAQRLHPKYSNVKSYIA